MNGGAGAGGAEAFEGDGDAGEAGALSAIAAPLAGRAVLVTGAASGIGRAVAGLCTAAGAVVGGLDTDRAALDALAAGAAGRFVPTVADVRDETAVARAVAALDAETARLLGRPPGAIAGLVNCAGVGGYTGDVTETTPADWERVLGTNLTGAFLVSRAVLPRMARGGAVVHIGSQYGLVGGAGFPAYCAAKAGLTGLTRAMAVDHAPDGIRVNCVCPGPTDTPMLRRSAPVTGAPVRREEERVRQRSLLPSPGDPAQVAATVCFLLGPAAGHVTGAVVPVDGGWTAC
jgi:NAD(P)-dependent dehydrogenase (short-subunit alcohol dehydrogenase family)